MTSLTLIYTPENEWHGELAVRLHYDEFSGLGSAWFNVSDVLEFARSAGADPTETD